MPSDELAPYQFRPAGVRVRFGVFELDRAAGRLFRKRQPVKLAPQPMAMLIALVNKAGREVTREELAALWPEGTFVDFEAGIGSCVRKIRLALGDSAENPIFVKTIHGRGFCFIAAVQYMLPEASEVEAAERPFALPERVKAENAPGAEDIVSPPVNGGSLAAESLSPATGKRPFAGSRGFWALAAAGVLFAAGTAAWMIVTFRRAPPPDITVVPLTSFPGDEYDPSLSPDGSQVVFSWTGPDDNNIDLYIKQVDGERSMRRLTTDPGRDEFPAWSPDGQWIAFNRNLASILIVSPLGGEERIVAASDGRPSWTPDSKEVVYCSRKAGDSQTGVSAVSIATGQVRNILPAEANVISFDRYAYSPDGRFFAFARPTESQIFPRDTARRTTDLYVQAAGKAVPRRLTDFHKPIEGWTWLPDSKEILFCTNQSEQLQLWRINVEHDGSTPRLAEAAGCSSPSAVRYRAAPSQPASILVACQQQSTIVNLDALDTKSAASHSVVSSTRRDSYPSFSSDGSRFVFISNRTGTDEVWMADTSGEHPEQLTSSNNPGGSLESPGLAPDGSRFLYLRASPDERQIVSAPVGPGVAKVLRHGHALEGNPTWSRDGRSIYFTAFKDSAFQIWKMAAEEGAVPVQITFHGGVEALESVDAKTVYFMREWGSGALWSMPAGATDSQAVRVIETGVHDGYWAPAAAGIYFIEMGPQLVHHPAKFQKMVYFVDFATKRRTEVGATSQRLVVFAPGLAASPDGLHLLFPEEELENIDIMLLKNFR